MYEYMQILAFDTGIKPLEFVFVASTSPAILQGAIAVALTTPLGSSKERTKSGKGN